MVGFLTLLVGAWAGIVAFVGPLWGFNASGTTSWVWNTNHWLLHLVPGAVAFVAGLLMMGQAPARRATFRAPFFVSGLLAAAAGAWLILGPDVWPMLYSGPVYGPSSGNLSNFLNRLGANLGPGILLAIFGGMALKSVIKDREVALPAEPEDADVPPGSVSIARGAPPLVSGPFAGSQAPAGPGPTTASRESTSGGEGPLRRREPPGKESPGGVMSPPDATAEQRAAEDRPPGEEPPPQP